MSTERERKFALALAEAQQSQLRAMHYKVRIETGTWKSRIGNVRRGFDGPLYTEAEIVQDEVATMRQHISNAEDHLEHAKAFVGDPEVPRTMYGIFMADKDQTLKG